MEIHTLSRNLTNEKISMPYPNIRIMNPSPAFALVFQALPKGDISVVFEKDGKLLRPGCIERSAFNLKKLMAVSEVIFNIDEEISLQLNTGADILDAISRC